MGYTTSFEGEFKITPPLSAVHRDYLAALASTRRMRRDPLKAAAVADPVREAVNLPVGVEGEFCVFSTENYGQDRTPDIVDYNDSGLQPSLWLQWTPNKHGDALRWDEGEQFYRYVQWLRYLIDKFFVPWGYKLNGEVEWQGEDSSDMGKIEVTDNSVQVLKGYVCYERTTA